MTSPLMIPARLRSLAHSARWTLVAMLLAGASACAGVPSAADQVAKPDAVETVTWQRWIQAPASRRVVPVRVVESTEAVRHPQALLSGGITTLIRVPAVPKPAWPRGTQVMSSFSVTGVDSVQHVIDGSLVTSWPVAHGNDKSDSLLLTLSAPQSLSGITLRAAAGHALRDFDVAVHERDGWHTVAQVRANMREQLSLRWPAVSVSQLRVLVPHDADAAPTGRIAQIWPGATNDDPPASVVLDFGRDVVGTVQLDLAGASADHPGLRLAFSETLRFLTERSDFTRSDNGDTLVPGTDQLSVPFDAHTWTDQHGCDHGRQVCADGLHGFRYLRISLDALPSDAPLALPNGTVELRGVSLHFSGYLGRPETYTGWFESSDSQLNRYWYDAAYTDELGIASFDRADIDPRQADSPYLEGKTVLQDGAKRDRDPYVGDLAVSARTAYLSHGPSLDGASSYVLLDLAQHQRADGWIPPASIRHYQLPLFEYPLWWVESVWDHVLYTGDLGLAARVYPQLQRLLDVWYPAVTDHRGLLNKGLGGTGSYGDYAFLPRRGEATYYNALYVLALQHAARWARALQHPQDAERWTRRADEVGKAINAHLWDASAGAYLDSATGPKRHAQDGNALAVIAGIASPERAHSALTYLSSTTARPWGNAFMDNNTLIAGGDQRVYPFIAYFDLAARFQCGMTASALEEIDRMYGWMASHDPYGTDWEGIGAHGLPYEAGFTSMAHGWSTGVLPVLTNELLGIVPTGPGFSTWRIAPHPGRVHWAKGQVPTPHGPLQVSWSNDDTRFTLNITVPPGTRGDVALPARHGGTVTLDGAPASLVPTDSSNRPMQSVCSDPRMTLQALGAGDHVIVLQAAH